jgi:hypothetical protein
MITSSVTYYQFNIWNQLIKTTADKVVLETDVEGNENSQKHTNLLTRTAQNDTIN